MISPTSRSLHRRARQLYYAHALRGHFGVARSVRLSVRWRSCLGCRHAGCLQLSHRRPPEMCGLRTRPRTDVDPPRFLPPSNCHRPGGAYRLAAPAEVGETLLASQCSELYLYLVVCGFLLDKITRDFCTALELHLLLHQLRLPFFFFFVFCLILFICVLSICNSYNYYMYNVQATSFDGVGYSFWKPSTILL